MLPNWFRPLMSHDATPEETYFAHMFQLKVSTYTIKKKGDYFVHIFFMYLLLFLNPFTAKDVLINFTLSNTRRFYSSKGNPLAVKGLKNSIKNLP